nr:MAG: protein of unknown function DUF285 [Bacteriophage sp.]
MGFNKYQKLKKQYSYNGSIWVDVDPPEYKKGDIIEVSSKDCGYIEPIYRWQLIENDFICENYNKYQKLIYQVSYDNGASYVNVEPEQTKKGELIEQNSVFCDYGITWELVENGAFCFPIEDLHERWTVIPNEFICQGTDKYEKLKYQISMDNEIWYDAIPEQTKIGELIDRYSASCGFVFNEFNFKFKTKTGGGSYVYLSKRLVDGSDVLKLYKTSDIYHIAEDYKYGFKFENTNYTFSYCENIIEFDFTDYNSANIVDMSNMFDSCKSLVSLNISNFVTSNVTSINKMFYYCESLTSLDLSNFDTSKITSLNSVFDSCKSLASLNVKNWNTSQVTSMNRTFYNCFDLTELDLTNWETIRVHDFRGMFGHSSFKNLNLSSFYTLNATKVGYMFAGCSGLEKLDLTNFDFSNVANNFDYMENIFLGCDSLNYIKCREPFKEWCLNNKDIIALPQAMRENGNGTWDIVG